MQRITKTILLVLLLVWNANCVNGSKNSLPFLAYLDLGGKGNSFSVSQITPGSGVSDIPMNTAVQVTFSEAFDSSSVTTSTFFIKQATTLIPASLTLNNTTAVLTPNSALSSSTTYTVTIAKEIRSSTGISLKEDMIWNFTTAATVDVIAPAVSLTTPNNGNSAVPNNSSVSVAFSENVDCTTIDTTTFLVDDGGAVAGTVTCGGTSATFAPAAALAPNTAYTARITTGARDLAGNPLTSIYAWNFMTGAAPDVTAPNVSFINPANTSNNFSVNGSLSIAFDEPIDCATFTTANITLTDGFTAVVGTVGCIGSATTFTPTLPLAYATTYTATISTGVKDLAGNPLAAPFTWSFSTGVAPDSIAPTVSLVIPANALTGVGINTNVSAVFSEPMNCATITTASFTLNGGAAVPGTVSCAGTSATFDPTAALAFNTTYTASITTTAKDLAGNSIPALYTWTFTTGLAPDTTAPTVSFVSPSNAATAVPVNSSLSIAFSEAIDCATITTANITLSDGSAIAGTVGCSGTAATFTPTVALAYGTNYTATIATAVKDVAGNSLTVPYTWTFSTSAAPDSTAPTVSFVTPANALTGVGINTNVSAVFSEPMNCATITTASFTLNGGVAVPGTVSCAGTSATFDPTPALAYNTTYTASLTTTVKDLAGNSIPALYTWTFTTGLAPDTTAPTVSFVNPIVGGTAVPVNSSLSIAFSEAIDCATITTANITLSDGSGIAGTVGCSGTVATFDPTPTLAFSTTYTATVSTAVKDVAGNSLAVAYSWTFTTGVAPDTTAPTVSLIAPANGSTGVATNANISVSFSETMDCTTLNTASFTLNNGAAVVGTVSCSGTTATFSPTAFLPAGTNHTATITVAAKDLAGNAIGAAFNWNFTTGAALDVTAPGLVIGNARNNTVLESGFVSGTATDGGAIATVEVSLDSGPYALATGTNNWKFPLPAGAATWKSFSQHTIQVRATDASNNVTISPVVTVRKGTNKDINGDGFTDLVAPEYGQGLVFIFHSSGAAGITIPNAQFASKIIIGTAASFFGKTATMGDFNGDGYADVAIGSPRFQSAGTNNGRVYLFYSSGTAGITTSFAAFANSTLTGTNGTTDEFGSALATGDINGDGYTDLIVGAPSYNGSRGRVYVFHSAGAAGITAATVTAGGGGASSFRTGGAASERFGYSLATGNINGGNEDDLVVGAPGYIFNAGYAGGGIDWGRVYVYYGAAAGLTATIHTITNNTGNAPAAVGVPGGAAQLGYSVAVGDMNLDGFNDVIAGAPFFIQVGNPNVNQQGRIVAYYSAGAGGIGTPLTLGGAIRAFTGMNGINGQFLGLTLAVRDMDLDGRADVMTASAFMGPNTVYVYLTPAVGGATRDTTMADVTMVTGGLYGINSMLNGPGIPIGTSDVNGDGLPDLLINGSEAVRIYHSTGGVAPITNNPASADSVILGSGLFGGIGGAASNTNEFGSAIY
ncbi:Ig-like domain-containing protein [Leptospira sp. FAT2]|uniref:Ig-like domain-containing protein n=1 Tax=Leptospira sanjuanensis TaxID=2879643 RepID=UPI001EE8F5DC|nr:Ig-like domain-containing protein [Leptospira sanjuanensis]MCG6192933.1 Ig-like domain-containing protein [Leptospira sanjuanensis]